MLKATKKIFIMLGQFILMFYAISLLYPFIWMIINSFKTNTEFYANIWSFPKQMNFKNYASALYEHGLIRYFFNSAYITAIGTFLQVFFSASASYVVAKYKFKGRNIIFFLAVSTFLIPPVTSLPALFNFMMTTGLFNKHLGLIVIYSSGLSMNFIILYGFFKGVSWEYAEAAYVDGANDFQIFFKIMLHMVKPGLFAVSLISAINIWNDYFSPYMFLQEESKYTVSVGLYHLVQIQQYAADWTVLFAALTIATLPTLILYLILQENLIESLTTGGLKG